MKNKALLTLIILFLLTSIIALSATLINTAKLPEPHVIWIKQNFHNGKPYIYTMTYWYLGEVLEYDFDLWADVESMVKYANIAGLRSADYYFKGRVIRFEKGK